VNKLFVFSLYITITTTNKVKIFDIRIFFE